MTLTLKWHSIEFHPPMSYSHLLITFLVLLPIYLDADKVDLSQVSTFSSVSTLHVGSPFSGCHQRDHQLYQSNHAISHILGRVLFCM